MATNYLLYALSILDPILMGYWRVFIHGQLEYFSPHECVDSCIDYFIRRDTCSDDAGVNVQDNSF